MAANDSQRQCRMTVSPWASLRAGLEAALQRRTAVLVPRDGHDVADLGFGRVVASDKEATNMLVKLV